MVLCTIEIEIDLLRIRLSPKYELYLLCIGAIFSENDAYLEILPKS